MGLASKAKLLSRVRRLRGQLDAVERAIDGDVDHTDLLMLLAAVRGAANAVTAEVLVDLVHREVVEVVSEEGRASAADRLRDVVRTYLK